MTNFLKVGAAVLFLTAGAVASRAEEPPELTDAQIEEASTFIFNNALFVGMHEGGHMLISEFNLPVLGREEDAVDNLASVMLLEAANEEMDAAIQDAADGWFLLAEGKEAVSEEELLDEHSLDEQRAYSIVCMMTGADPEVFGEFADSLDYPEDRREDCYSEYINTRDSWVALLDPYILPEGAPASKIEIQYEEPNEDNAIVAELLKQGQLLETMAEALGGSFKLEDGIKFTARNCGEENAYWDASSRELTFCYEFANLSGDVIVKYLQEEGAGR